MLFRLGEDIAGPVAIRCYKVIWVGDEKRVHTQIRSIHTWIITCATPPIRACFFLKARCLDKDIAGPVTIRGYKVIWAGDEKRVRTQISSINT